MWQKAGYGDLHASPIQWPREVDAKVVRQKTEAWLEEHKDVRVSKLYTNCLDKRRRARFITYFVRARTEFLVYFVYKVV